jgi:hypothetical protein
MGILRKIALGLLLATAAAVLVMAGWELWSYHQWAGSPVSQPGLSAEDRARELRDHMDLLSKRVSDMELLVLILLGTSGLYAVVFVASSYFSATSFARQADQTINNIQDQIGYAMGDLRELQEQTERRLHRMMEVPAIPALPSQQSEKAPVRVNEAPREQPASASRPYAWEVQIATIAARLAALQDRDLNEDARLEVVRDEHSAIWMEAEAGEGAGAAFAGLYLGFGRIFGAKDGARSRFYLERALRLAEPDSTLASEIHYQLACRFAASHDFPYAVRELAAAFEHQFKTLDERLANDIEEGGRLYELASTAPFDKAVNDLLLNMSIGIG